MKEYYQMSRTEAQKSVNGSTHPLSQDQIKKNQEKYGPNALVEEKKKSILQIFLEQYKDFLVIILIAAAACFRASWRDRKRNRYFSGYYHERYFRYGSDH